VRSLSALVAFDFQLISRLPVKGKVSVRCAYLRSSCGGFPPQCLWTPGRVSVVDRNPDEVKVARIGCRLLGMRGSGQNRVSAKAGWLLTNNYRSESQF